MDQTRAPAGGPTGGRPRRRQRLRRSQASYPGLHANRFPPAASSSARERGVRPVARRSYRGKGSSPKAAVQAARTRRRGSRGCRPRAVARAAEAAPSAWGEVWCSSPCDQLTPKASARSRI